MASRCFRLASLARASLAGRAVTTSFEQTQVLPRFSSASVWIRLICRALLARVLREELV